MSEEVRASLQEVAQAYRRIRGVIGTADYFRAQGYEVFVDIRDEVRAMLVLSKDGVSVFIDCSYVHVPTAAELWIRHGEPFSLNTEEND